MNDTTKAVAALVVSVVLCFAAAGIGGIATSKTVGTWYASIRKPVWTPPGWVFGPVWSALYLTMAVAAWLVWRQRGVVDVRLPIVLFLVQLALNAAWSWLFFALQSPGLAFAELLVLWAAILGTLLTFWQAAPLAGWLMTPYLAWVTFAAALNFAIWRLNA